jgi:hypothetical protein
MHFHEVTADRLIILQRASLEHLVLFLQDDELGEKAFDALQAFVVANDALYPNLVCAFIDTSLQIAQLFNVVRVPQFRIYQGSRIVAKRVGVTSETHLERHIRATLSGRIAHKGT